MSSRFLVRQGSQTVIVRIPAQEPPSPVAVAQCTLIVELVMAAVWFGLWADYDMAENCDKKLQLWYALMLGGIVFGLICQVGVVIAAKKESKPALKLCKVLIKLDQFFEFGVHLWGRRSGVWQEERPGRRRRVQGARDVAKGQCDGDPLFWRLGDGRDPVRCRGRRREGRRKFCCRRNEEPGHEEAHRNEEDARESMILTARPPPPFIDPDYQV